MLFVHRVRHARYFRQLLQTPHTTSPPTSCSQFVEKDPELAVPVLQGLLKFWPITNSHKEVLFIGELEEVLEITKVGGMRGRGWGGDDDGH